MSTISPDDRRLQDEASGWSRLRKNVFKMVRSRGNVLKEFTLVSLQYYQQHNLYRGDTGLQWVPMCTLIERIKKG